MVLERAFTDLRQHQLNKKRDIEEIFSVPNLGLKLDLVIHKNPMYIKIQTFWKVTSCSLVTILNFQKILCLHSEGRLI